MKLIYTAFFLFINFALLSQTTFQNAFPNLTFNFPVDIQNSGVSGDNRLFVVEQPGRIKVFQNQSNTTFSSTFLDITNKVNYTPGQEKGLLGLAFHPNFQQNGHFYVSYTGFGAGGFISINVERFTVNPNNPNTVNSNTGCQVISFNKNQSDTNHNGCAIAFGPDGHLYISVGDGGGAGDPQANSQNLNSLFGKVLRLNINTSCPGYGIPSGNPLINTSGRNEIYAWGLRNTWRMSWDFQTNRLWGGDVGQGRFEEINLIENGGNYGWRYYEAFSVQNSTPPVPTNTTFPIYSYNYFQGDRSISGGYVYRGSENSGLIGKYIFGDFISGRIWSLDYNAQSGATNRTLLFDSDFPISSFGKDVNNELYFAAYGFSGRIYKLVSEATPPTPPPAPSDCSISANNCTISFSGLNGNDFIKVFDAAFQEVWTCNPYNGSPCNVNESFTAETNGTYYVQGCEGSLDPYNLSECGVVNPPNPGDGGGGCNVSSQNCAITMTGLNSNDFIKIFDTSLEVVWTCNPYGGTPCNATEVVSTLNEGTYYVQACGDFSSYEVSGCGASSPCDNLGGDSDGDGVCDDQDCQPTNPSLPTTPGTPCNDFNANTTNDVIISDRCTCEGTPIQAGCSVSTENCSFNFSGLNSNDFIKIFNSNFQVVWTCSPYNGSPCSASETFTAQSSGTYYVQGCDGDFTPYTLTSCNGGGNTNNNNCTSTSNVAVGKSTQQSSTLSVSGFTGSSSKAVDGNTNGAFFTSPASNSSVAATQNQFQPYWQVDLQSNHLIEQIRVFNRTDGVDKANNAYVLVSDQPFTSNNLNTARSQAKYESFISGNIGSPSTVSPNTSGRYARIQMQGSGFLTLAEVEVIGCTSSNFSAEINNTVTDSENIKAEVVVPENTEKPERIRGLNSFIIYPNPAKDELNVNLNSIIGLAKTIQIYSAKASLVKEQRIDPLATNPISIDLQGMENGLYLVTVTMEDNQIISQPFIVHK